MIFKIMAITILAIFYGIYFSKMFLQKKQGIQTHQIGKRKEKRLHLVETLMSVATLLVVLQSTYYFLFCVCNHNAALPDIAGRNIFGWDFW